MRKSILLSHSHRWVIFHWPTCALHLRIWSLWRHILSSNLPFFLRLSSLQFQPKPIEKWMCNFDEFQRMLNQFQKSIISRLGIYSNHTFRLLCWAWPAISFSNLFITIRPILSAISWGNENSDSRTVVPNDMNYMSNHIP